MNQPPPESTNDITLFAYGRDESSTTIECYIGSSLYGDTSGTFIYNLMYKAAGEPTFTSIYSYQGSGAQPMEIPFIIKKYWTYLHKHGSKGSVQYYVNISNTDDFIDTFSNTITVPAFSGFGSKKTRSSSNGPLKSSRKTRNETPRF